MAPTSATGSVRSTTGWQGLPKPTLDQPCQPKRYLHAPPFPSAFIPLPESALGPVVQKVPDVEQHHARPGREGHPIPFPRAGLQAAASLQLTFTLGKRKWIVSIEEEGEVPA